MTCSELVSPVSPASSEPGCIQRRRVGESQSQGCEFSGCSPAKKGVEQAKSVTEAVNAVDKGYTYTLVLDSRESAPKT
jgi:hypothetical protein